MRRALELQSFIEPGNNRIDGSLRAGPAPEDPDLIVRRIGDILWAGYCSPAYVEQYGAPASPTDLRNHQVIGASSMERLPLEHAITDQVRQFKAIRFQ